MIKIWTFIFSLFVVMVLAQSALAVNKLAGSEWTSINNDRQFIRFKAEGRLAGHGGCNRFFGGYELRKNGELRLGTLASTKMACPEPKMSEETEFFKALEAASSFVRDAGQLFLFNSEGEKILVLQMRDLN